MRIPQRSSNVATLRLNAGCVMLSSSAAREKLRNR
jgi:hypothetical protein